VTASTTAALHDLDTLRNPNTMRGAACSPADGGELVISFTVPHSTAVSVSFTATGPFDTVLVLMKDRCSYSAAVSCNDDSAVADTHGGSFLSSSLTSGTYFLSVDGYSVDSFGSFTLAYTFQVAPAAGNSPPAPPPATAANGELQPSPSDTLTGSSSSAVSPPTAGDRSGKKHLFVVVVISISGVALFAAVATILCCCCRFGQRQPNPITDDDDGISPKPRSPQPYGTPDEYCFARASPQPSPAPQCYVHVSPCSRTATPPPEGTADVAPYLPHAEVSVATTNNGNDDPGVRQQQYHTRPLREQMGRV